MHSIRWADFFDDAIRNATRNLHCRHRYNRYTDQSKSEKNTDRRGLKVKFIVQNNHSQKLKKKKPSSCTHPYN